MKKFVFALLVGLTLSAASLMAAGLTPEKPKFPAPDGYITLLGDLHQHTVFSDGTVWPTFRVQEAKREGLDVIALTDHIEYIPHKGDVIIDYSRPYAIALPEAQKKDILLIPGLEITRGNTDPNAGDPIKHVNCLFLTNFNALVVPEFKDAVYAAAAQGAYIFWDHPAWAQPGNKCVWYPEMTEFLDKGILKGFEVVNWDDFQPDVIEWCQKYNVTMMGGSDTHDPIAYEVDWTKGEHRPMTLIFAKERTLDSVKEALFAGRTAVYHHTPANNLLIGNEKWLRPLFNKAFTYQPVLFPEQNGANGKINVLLKNDLPFSVELKRTDYHWIETPATVRIPANGTTTIEVTIQDSNFGITFDVQNLVIGKDRLLSVKIGS